MKNVKVILDIKFSENIREQDVQEVVDNVYNALHRQVMEDFIAPTESKGYTKEINIESGIISRTIKIEC